MSRNRTPRSVRARKSARSAGVSAKSSTLQTSAEALSRCQFQAPERVVEVGRIAFRMTTGEVMRALPQGVGMFRPRQLIWRQPNQGVGLFVWGRGHALS